MLFIPKKYKLKRDISFSKEDLINFEIEIKSIYEKSLIKGPIHLSGNNEEYLIRIFKHIDKKDYVFSTWRSHYHAILHGLKYDYIKKMILKGKSMSINSSKHKFYSSSIVGGCIPISLGTAMAIKRNKSDKQVWCFVGDMSFESGIFHEAYKYSKFNKLPLNFVIEDNSVSTNTPTKSAWGGKSKPPKDVIYYKYKRRYPHHGTGKWILF